MRNARALGICLAMIGLAAPVAAQPDETPRPGPEHRKLDYFVGKWRNEGEIKNNPIMPAGRFRGTDRCDWFEGRFAVICHSEGTGPSGTSKGLGILGYSPDAEAYTYYFVDSSGTSMTSVPLGKVRGDEWIYDDRSEAGGVEMVTRYTIKIVSPTAHTFRWEMRGDDDRWITIIEGRSTRAK